jgi:hypothetical protein
MRHLHDKRLGLTHDHPARAIRTHTEAAKRTSAGPVAQSLARAKTNKQTLCHPATQALPRPTTRTLAGHTIRPRNHTNSRLTTRTPTRPRIRATPRSTIRTPVRSGARPRIHFNPRLTRPNLGRSTRPRPGILQPAALHSLPPTT